MKSFEETKKGQESKKGAPKKTGKKGTEKDEYTPQGGNNALNSSVGSVGSLNSLDSADESGGIERKNSTENAQLSEVEKARLLLKCK